MDRRRETRVLVNLNAVVVNDKVLPIGCRVGNISSTGILLRHEGSEDQSKIKADDKVEIRISLKRDDGRKVIQLPLTVIRQDQNHLGGQFPAPQPELMKLVEPYRKSDHETVVPFLTTSANQQVELPTNSELAPSDPTTPTRAQAEPIKPEAQNDAIETIPNGIGDLELSDLEQSGRKPYGPSRIFVIGVAGIISLLVGLNVFLLQDVRTLTSRIIMLESRIASSATLTRLPDSVVGATFSSQIAVLTQKNQTIESRLTLLESPANRLELHSDNPVAIGFNQPATESQAASEGWVINLLSLHNEQAAIEFAQRALTQGMTADVRLEVEDQDQVWRVQMGGFSSRAEAVSFSVQAQKTLGLSSVWIFKASK
ncbi:MAG: hypothetical protein ACJAVI_004054 [Candidatus Azotimanducaceae bacterium]